MSILNRGWIYDSITRNQDSGSVSYRWTHGANDTYLGSGIFYYAIPYFLKAQVCVCLGSGGGYVPRLMTDATWELGETDMYPENEFGQVYVVDATNSVNGEVDWSYGDSFLRSHFNPRFINSTTEDAFYNFFVKRDIKIDYLHIDADHTYEGCKLDFDLYSTIMNENGIISVHDTDIDYWNSFETYEGEPHDVCIGPSEFIESVSDEWEVFNLFDYKEKSVKVRSSGLTLLRKIDEV
ncbi:class I SAM-dependent methyltransferase [bacterium]|nr:class I SAM-dependent methyltransferase [bacterium]